MLPEEKLFVVTVLVAVCLISLGVYSGYTSSQERKKITPACKFAGGKIIESYDGTWMCVKSLNVEK